MTSADWQNIITRQMKKGKKNSHYHRVSLPLLLSKNNKENLAK